MTKTSFYYYSVGERNKILIDLKKFIDDLCKRSKGKVFVSWARDEFIDEFEHGALFKELTSIIEKRLGVNSEASELYAEEILINDRDFARIEKWINDGFDLNRIRFDKHGDTELRGHKTCAPKCDQFEFLKDSYKKML